MARSLTPAFALGVISLAWLASCGGSGGDSSDEDVQVVSYSLGGSISGLTSSGLVLANGSDTLALATGATRFSFGDYNGGSTYAVKVLTQPDGQTCAVSNGSGSLLADLDAVSVVCRGYMAYVTNGGSNSIAMFSVTPASGMLEPLATATLPTSYAPSAVALDAGGSYAYVVHNDDKELRIYGVASDGLLSLAGTASAGSNSYGLALGVASSSLYVTNYSDKSVSQFSLSSAGLPAAMSSKTVETQTNPVSMAFTPDGAYAYVANKSSDSISLYSVSSSGALTALGTASISTDTDSAPVALAVDPDGDYLYVVLEKGQGVAQYAIGAAGLLTRLSRTADTGLTPKGIVISPDGRYAYVTNSGDSTVSQYVLAAGYLTALATPTVVSGTGPTALSVSPDGRYVYVVNSSDATVSQYAIQSGGALQALATAQVSTSGSKPTGIAVR